MCDVCLELFTAFAPRRRAPQARRQSRANCDDRGRQEQEADMAA